MISVYVHHIWLRFTLIRISGDIEENPGPKRSSDQSFSILNCFLILTVLPHTTTLRAYISLHNFGGVCMSETYLTLPQRLMMKILKLLDITCSGPIMHLIVRDAMFVYIIKVSLLWDCLMFITYNIVTQKEIVWIHGPFSKNFRNISTIVGWSFTEGTDLFQGVLRWRWHWRNVGIFR